MKFYYQDLVVNIELGIKVHSAALQESSAGAHEDAIYFRSIATVILIPGPSMTIQTLVLYISNLERVNSALVESTSQDRLCENGSPAARANHVLVPPCDDPFWALKSLSTSEVSVAGGLSTTELRWISLCYGSCSCITIYDYNYLVTSQCI